MSFESSLQEGLLGEILLSQKDSRPKTAHFEVEDF